MGSNRKQSGGVGGRLFPKNIPTPPRMMSRLPSSLPTKNKVKEKVLRWREIHSYLMGAQLITFHSHSSRKSGWVGGGGGVTD